MKKSKSADRELTETQFSRVREAFITKLIMQKYHKCSITKKQKIPRGLNPRIEILKTKQRFLENKL